jgi:hypothetical protein
MSSVSSHLSDSFSIAHSEDSLVLESNARIAETTAKIAAKVAMEAPRTQDDDEEEERVHLKYGNHANEPEPMITMKTMPSLQPMTPAD